MCVDHWQVCQRILSKNVYGMLVYGKPILACPETILNRKMNSSRYIKSSEVSSFIFSFSFCLLFCFQRVITIAKQFDWSQTRNLYRRTGEKLEDKWQLQETSYVRGSRTEGGLWTAWAGEIKYNDKTLNMSEVSSENSKKTSVRPYT